MIPPTLHQRGYKYRLYPTPEQAVRMRQYIGVCRLIYNLGLECREKFWREHKRNTGHYISYFSQSYELTQLRAEVDWIRDVPRCIGDAALKDLDGAFQNWFAGRAGYPKPRRKGVNDSFRVLSATTRVERINAKWSHVLVPKLGMVKFRDTRRIGKLKNVTFKCVSGKWYVSIKHEIETTKPSAPAVAVGIDRGIANTLALSTGERLSVPKSLVTIERRQRRAQRALSRKVRGSARYRRQRQRVASLQARGARIRMDWMHRASLGIVMRFNKAVVEDLNIQSMTASGGGAGKRGLNRAIRRQGWGMFDSMLTYKLEERGGELVRVPPAYTSQTCSCCGTIDRESRESQAVFSCRHCGHTMHADENAALNILRLGSTQSLRVEEAGYGSNEARTRRGRKLTENQALVARGC